MYCEKCGTKLLDSAAFCTNCGASTKEDIKMESKQKILDTDIQLEVRPSFKFGYMMFPTIIIWGVFILISSFTMLLVNVVVALCVFIILCLILAIILIIKTSINKKQYANYCYYFYKTKIIYKDSFLNLSEKEIKYKYIREIAMNQTLLQRLFNIGSITLYTNAESGMGNGVYIKNIENVQDVYTKIKTIIDV